MYLMYVDESGDTGIAGSPSQYYILTGIILHERDWSQVLEQLIAFRKEMKAKFSLRLRDEIHAVDFANRGKAVPHIPKHHRIAILKSTVAAVAAMPQIDIINVVVDKTKATDPEQVFSRAWQTLLQRYENTMGYGNFKGNKFRTADNKMLDNGVVLTDETSDELLRRLTRKMRRYNPIPNRYGGGFRDIPLVRLIEDVSMRKSHHSYLIQVADVVAYCLRQHISPNKHMRRHGAAKLFCALEPALCTKASPGSKYGIVWT